MVPVQRVLVSLLLLNLVVAPGPAKAIVSVHVAAPGLHAMEDARHSADQLNLAPATAMIQPRRLGASNPLLRREIFGFAPYWELRNNAEWNYNLLSTVAYFGLDVNDDGTFATNGGGATGWNSAELTTVINAAHQAGDRVVVVIKDFRDASINNIVTSAAAQSLIDGTMAAIQTKGLDGVNVDFEPSGSPLYPDIPQGLIKLMTAMSAQVHTRYPGSEVSMDTYAGAASCTPDLTITCAFRIDQLAPVVDAMFVMAYDSVFSNMPGRAGPQSPMNGWTFNDTVDVAQYLTKAPASKIILGVPYYGYVWSTRDGSPYSTAVSGAQAITYTGVVGNLSCGALAQTFGWDATAQSPWSAWFSPRSGDPCSDNTGTPREMYFDNATSLGIKYDLVNANNLRGAGMWTLGYDTGHSELWNELATKFTGATPWTSLGGTLAPGSGPDASSWRPSRTDVFTRGTDDALWQTTWNGTNALTSVSLGGTLTSDPGAVAWGTDRIDIFVRGSDNALWHKWWDTNHWGGWESLGGNLTSGPEVSSWSRGRLDVFARGADNGLWHKSWSGTLWSGWEPLGGAFASDPTAVSWGSGRIDVFVRGSDNAVWHKWFTSGRWYGWESLGGNLASAPDASSCGYGHLDVFVLTATSTLSRMGFNGVSWGGWQDVGGQLASEPGVACASGVYGVDAFAHGTDGALWHIEVPAS